MELFLEILKQINIAQTIILFAGLWFFYNRLDNKINKTEESLNKRIDAVEESLNKRIDNLEKRIADVENKLTNRIDNLYNLFAGFLYNKKDDSAA